MLPIVQTAAYIPITAVLFMTLTMWLSPPIGHGEMSLSLPNTFFPLFVEMFLTIGIPVSLIGAVVLRNRMLTAMFIVTVIFAGSLLGRTNPIPISDGVGIAIWSITTIAILLHLVMVEMQGRRMFWSRWDND
ncbi:MAG: hypothetical protein HQ478_02560 [Chloroflexi bacterium]|nr:hypothetical protein [Chloroflexota bacterium]